MLQNQDLADYIVNAAQRLNFDSVRMTLKIHQSKRHVTRPNSKSVEITQSYAQTKNGQRFYDEVFLVSDGHVSRRSAYCDGSKCANVSYLPETHGEKQQLIAIEHNFLNEHEYGFMAASWPLRSWHVGLKPLSDALPAAESHGRSEIMGRFCSQFLFRSVGTPGRTWHHIYHLDEETAQPLKIEAFSDDASLKEKKPFWVWQANSLDRTQDHLFAKTSTYSEYVVQKKEGEGGGLTWDLDMEQSIEVASIEYDRPAAASEFWPSLQPGVFIVDSIAKKSYNAPGISSADIAAMANPAEPPIRVTEGSGGQWAVGIGVSASLLVLALAVVLWRRSR